MRNATRGHASRSRSAVNPNGFRRSEPGSWCSLTGWHEMGFGRRRQRFSRNQRTWPTRARVRCRGPKGCKAPAETAGRRNIATGFAVARERKLSACVISRRCPFGGDKGRQRSVGDGQGSPSSRRGESAFGPENSARTSFPGGRWQHCTNAPQRIVQSWQRLNASATRVIVPHETDPSAR